MRLPFFTCALLASAIVASCGSSKIEKDSMGITVNLDRQNENDVRKVRLQVWGDKIIRVSATPDSKFAEDESLVVLKPESSTKFGRCEILRSLGSSGGVGS